MYSNVPRLLVEEVTLDICYIMLLFSRYEPEVSRSNSNSCLETTLAHGYIKTGQIPEFDRS